MKIYYSDSSSDSEPDANKYRNNRNYNRNNNDSDEYKQGVISSYLNLPNNQKGNESGIDNPAISSKLSALPPPPKIDFQAIHMELKNIFIDPFDQNPESHQVPKYPTVFDDVHEETPKLFEWKTFQLPNVPDVDVSQITNAIHQKFDMLRLVELMRKT